MLAELGHARELAGQSCAPLDLPRSRHRSLLHDGIADPRSRAPGLRPLGFRFLFRARVRLTSSVGLPQPAAEGRGGRGAAPAPFLLPGQEPEVTTEERVIGLEPRSCASGMLAR